MIIQDEYTNRTDLTKYQKYHLRHRDKRNADARAYKLKNKDRVYKKARDYKKIHREEIKVYQRKWEAENKEKLREYWRVYNSKKEHRQRNTELAKKWYWDRVKNDVGLLTIRRLRGRITTAIRCGYKKTTKTEVLLGAKFDEVIKHLESNFLPGMSWDNHGLHGWHIDHIKPISAFDLSVEEEQKKAFNYKNLQPLWAKDNLIKSDKYEI